jgi:hypothetical protein
MILEFSDSDINQSKIVTPAWYRVRIDDVTDKISNDGGSTNSWLKGTILFNADNGSKEFEGVPTPFLWMFNSKGAWAAIGLYAALGVEIKPGIRVGTDALKGKEVDAYITNDLYKGVVQNKMAGQYRTPRVAETVG